MVCGRRRIKFRLLYGRDDFYRTLQYAMALGYDADCNAAAGAIVGVRLGFQHIAALPQFKMPGSLREQDASAVDH